ncbi:MAG: GHKL domain-containing protein [Clostridium sp.]|nr:GHKL domain-containing protein [Clostridium sp.]
MKKLSFENKIIILAIFITLIPLILSYLIFYSDKIIGYDEEVKGTLKTVAFSLSNDSSIIEKLAYKENDKSIQEHTKKFITEIKDVDIIVIGDMTGEKYSHIYENQIGEKYVNDDNERVIKEGVGYYSLMEGSAGVTLRRFEPIFYQGNQVGFVMVGKYRTGINEMTLRITLIYVVLFVISFIVAVFLAKKFAKVIKRATLGMEPDDITTLYKKQNIIINNVKEGIIALNKENEITEVNKECYRLFENYPLDKVLERLKPYINERKSFDMKELIINGKKIFVTLSSMFENENYYGMIITFKDKENISKLAKEITGVDEVVKNLRATIHEFKNQLHVILGLLELEEYDEAIVFIKKIQRIKEQDGIKFNTIEDPYIRAVMISRELVARERKIDFKLNDESFLYEKHDLINSYDLVTILGNLIENAFEACVLNENVKGKVEVFLYEDSEKILIEVQDDGKEIDKELKNNIFIEGVSTKGKGRGTGLYLVKNRIELYNGEINIIENIDEKIFRVIILKGD